MFIFVLACLFQFCFTARVRDECNLDLTVVSKVNKSYVDKDGWPNDELVVSSLYSDKPIVDARVVTIGFWSHYTNGSSRFADEPSMVALLIYNSSDVGFPDSLVVEPVMIDLNQYPVGTYNCVPIKALSLLSFSYENPLWIGFLHRFKDAPRAVKQQPAREEDRAFNYFTTLSSGEGPPQQFPLDTARTEYHKLLMGISIKTESTCSGISCGNCTAREDCMWCLSTNSCFSTQMRSECASFTRDPTRCVPCTPYKSCSTCTRQKGCTWCEAESDYCVVSNNTGDCTTAIGNRSLCEI